MRLRVASGVDGHIRWSARLHGLRCRGRVRRGLAPYGERTMLLRRLLPAVLVAASVLVCWIAAAGGERDGDGHGHGRVVVRWEAVEGGVSEGGRDEDDGGRGVQRAGHGAADDLPVRPRQRDGEARGGGGGLRRHGGHGGGQERGGDGQDLVLPVEHDGGPAGRRVAERHVGDGARPREHADPEVPPCREASERVGHVAAAGDLDHVGAHRGGRLRLPRDHHGRLRLVLGPRGPAPPLLGQLDARPVVAATRHHRCPTTGGLLPLGAPAAVHLIGEALQLLLLLTVSTVLLGVVVGWRRRRRGEVDGRHVLAILVQALLTHVSFAKRHEELGREKERQHLANRVVQAGKMWLRQLARERCRARAAASGEGSCE
uniref:Uncharacterized protein n=1 Tax=Zea mays TaxID=4577 RepID=A0A804MNZ1_MAIZE